MPGFYIRHKHTVVQDNEKAVEENKENNQPANNNQQELCPITNNEILKSFSGGDGPCPEKGEIIQQESTQGKPAGVLKNSDNVECDKLVMLDGTEILIKLVKLTGTEIIYTLCDSSSSEQVTVAKKNVSKIIYASGGSTMFNKTEIEEKKIKHSDDFPWFPVLAILAISLAILIGGIGFLIPSVVLYIISLLLTLYSVYKFWGDDEVRGYKLVRFMAILHFILLVAVIVDLVVLLAS